jgi:hypothetical protein
MNEWRKEKWEWKEEHQSGVHKFYKNDVEHHFIGINVQLLQIQVCYWQYGYDARSRSAVQRQTYNIALQTSCDGRDCTFNTYFYCTNHFLEITELFANVV